MPAMPCTLRERRETIVDPRRQCEDLNHRLVDIILLGFCGVLAGCEDFGELAEGAKVPAGVLRAFLEFPPGIPAHDTVTRVFALLTPATVQEGLLPWLVERRGRPGDGLQGEGKTLGQTRPPPKLQAGHGVSAWAGQTGMTWGQGAVDAKANEITALPQLWALLALRDKIGTIEARGWQKALAETMGAGGGDYLLAVKDTQPTLPAEIPAAFATAATPPARSPRL
jgi:hypothetical protein